MPGAGSAASGAVAPQEPQALVLRSSPRAEPVEQLLPFPPAFLFVVEVPNPTGGTSQWGKNAEVFSFKITRNR